MVYVYDCLFWKDPDDVMRQSKNLIHLGLNLPYLQCQTLPFVAKRLEEKHELSVMKIQSYKRKMDLDSGQYVPRQSLQQIISFVIFFFRIDHTDNIIQTLCRQTCSLCRQSMATLFVQVYFDKWLHTLCYSYEEIKVTFFIELCILFC